MSTDFARITPAPKMWTTLKFKDGNFFLLIKRKDVNKEKNFKIFKKIINYFFQKVEKVQYS